MVELIATAFVVVVGQTLVVPLTLQLAPVIASGGVWQLATETVVIIRLKLTEENQLFYVHRQVSSKAVQSPLL